MRKRRVVVTGMGMVSPLGLDVESSWKRLINSDSGIRTIDVHPTIKVAGIVANFEPQTALEGIVAPSDHKRLSRSTRFAIKVADEALSNAGLLTENRQILVSADTTRIGTRMGTGIGGALHLLDVAKRKENEERVKPSDTLIIQIERVATVLSMRYRLHGPLETPSAACATGNVAIVDGFKDIVTGDADIMLVGGAEAAIDPVTLSLFDATRALSREQDPAVACLPFDERRSGFVFSEGAGALVLEEYEHARQRGAKILAEIVGYSHAADGNPKGDTEPSPAGMRRTMQAARSRAGEMLREGVVYINAHATGTQVGDRVEIESIRDVYQDASRVIVSSTKSQTGHTLGAAGAIEAIFAIKALQEGVVPATLGLQQSMKEAEGMNLPHEPLQADVREVINNSFGFGGVNAVTIYRRPEYLEERTSY